MFEAYSKRAVHVMFVARLKAGERGAAMLDVDDLLAALIIEDQGMRREALAGLFGRGDESNGPLLEAEGSVVRPLETHPPFFASEVASRLLQRVQESAPHSQPVPNSTDMPNLA